MKLKFIAAAAAAVVGMLASASSFAVISTPGTSGGGELFLVVYEQTAANGGLDQSFALDLGVTTSQFYAANSTPAVWATLNASTNSTWANFLATSDLGSLQYAVIGAQQTNSAAVQATSTAVFSTVTVGSEGLVQGATTNSQLTTIISGSISSYSTALNATGTHSSLANGESLNATGTDGYFQTANMAAFNNGLKFTNNNAVGVVSEFTSLYRAGTTGAAKALQQVEPMTVSFAQSGNAYVLNYGAVQAVPEASGSAMALAGMGLMGVFAIRRKKQA